MNLIEELIADHRRIREQLEPLRNSCVMDYGERQLSPIDRLKELTRQFRNMTLLHHMRREEERLFPQLEKIGVSIERGPIGMLLDEHRVIRECFRNLEALIEKIEKENPIFVDLFCHQLKELLQLFELHTEKEETVLYKIAKQYLYTGQTVANSESNASESPQIPGPTN